MRPQIVPLNLARVLAWFRHSAWITVLMGLLIIYMKYWRNGDVASSDAGKTILCGGILGILMAINVWAIIWPNQKKIIGAMRGGTAPDPTWGRNALYASRANFTMSFPMLWFMGSASHYPMDWMGILIAFVITAVLGLLVWNTVQRWSPSRF
jgi:uncharacterized membrane protein